MGRTCQDPSGLPAGWLLLTDVSAEAAWTRAGREPPGQGHATQLTGAVFYLNAGEALA